MLGHLTAALKLKERGNMTRSVLYAVLGVVVAALPLNGISLELAKGPEQWIDDGLALAVLFVISAAFLEPLIDRVEMALKLREPKDARSGWFWGIFGLSVALTFRLLETGIETATHHSPLGSLFLFLPSCLFPALSRWPGLQEFSVDAAQHSTVHWLDSSRTSQRG
jgi:hypothetical protein